MVVLANASSVLTILNYTHSHFSLNITADVIIQAMFIDSCSSNIACENFLHQYQLILYTDILIERFNHLYRITIVFSLYGGITILLNILISLGTR